MFAKQHITYLFLFFCIIWISVATPVSAAIDQRCMTLNECRTMRAQIGVPNGELSDGFVTRDTSSEAARVCPETMFDTAGGNPQLAGLCLPEQAAETKIAIGGKTQFLSLAEYIAYIYRYAMIVAGALCVILFIVAGVEWTLSGGDGSRIDDAKSRISNAVTGLILMATSYVVLYTIDPGLTTLKPPEVYLIRGINVFDPWCKDIPNADLLLAKARDLRQPNAPITPFATAAFTARPANAECGFEYHISASEGQMCKGTACTTGETCGQRTSASTPQCEPGNIVGRIYSSNFWEAIRDETAADRFVITAGRFFLGDGWIWDPGSGWIHGSGSGNLAIKAICADGNTIRVNTQNTVTPNDTEKSQFYQMSVTPQALEQAKNNCTGGQTLGYLAWFDFNELDLGDVAASSDWYSRAGAGCVLGIAGGWVGCGVGAVITLAVPLDRVLSADEGHYIGRDGSSGVDIMDEGDTALACYFKSTPTTHMLTQAEILSGIQINIDLNMIADIDDGANDRKKAYGSTYEQCWQTESTDGMRENYSQACAQGNMDDCGTACGFGDRSACATLCSSGYAWACSEFGPRL